LSRGPHHWQPYATINTALPAAKSITAAGTHLRFVAGLMTLTDLPGQLCELSTQLFC
jgi:hypothetical protein